MSVHVPYVMGSIAGAASSWLTAYRRRLPLQGAGSIIFGAAWGVSQVVLHQLTAQFPNSTIAKVGRMAIKVIGAFAIAWGVISLLGFSLTLGQFALLSLESHLWQYFLLMAEFPQEYFVCNDRGCRPINRWALVNPLEVFLEPRRVP